LRKVSEAENDDVANKSFHFSDETRGSRSRYINCVDCCSTCRTQYGFSAHESVANRLYVWLLFSKGKYTSRFDETMGVLWIRDGSTEYSEAMGWIWPILELGLPRLIKTRNVIISSSSIPPQRFDYISLAWNDSRALAQQPKDAITPLLKRAFRRENQGRSLSIWMRSNVRLLTGIKNM
uniref:SAC domain-containing protein n=1 Tax=Ascaris lumbricoides TaxID=6252 RepID=A0A0M3IBB5_ASCLU